ncbi:MAG: hypothetical protein IT423_02520, partial [Pirellulaceae bacterium]|nr:hypothetical protein [Pirellulaceae bacterium]
MVRRSTTVAQVLCRHRLLHCLWGLSITLVCPPFISADLAAADAPTGEASQAASAAEGTKPSAAPVFVRLEVFPTKISLGDSRATRQVVVSAFDAQGRVYDVTDQCKLALADTKVAVLESTRMRPAQNGQTSLTVTLGELTQNVPVEVSTLEVSKPIAFESEVLVALSKQGCNSGACHGSPSGKG